MSNDTAKTITTNIVPVQGTFEPLPPYECINLIGPAGTPFYAPVNPNLDGVNITNSTINSTTIGVTTPAAGAFTTASSTNQPVGNNDLTTKLYVDSLALGISWKQPVNAATTANITLSGAQTIDTVSVVAGDRVLVKDQSTQSENGIYIVGTPWTRSPDANAWDELVSALVFVESGGQAGSAWYCPVQPGGTLGVTAVTWNNFSVGGVYFAGTGLNLSGGNTFNITNTGVTAATYGSASAVPVIAVNQQGQITSASNTNIAIAGSQITSGTIDSARISGDYSGITGVGTLTNLTVSNTITGSISGNAATATNATNAATATNLAGGATGSLPYQSSAGTTTFVGIGSTGQILTVSGGVPTWAAPSATGDVVGPASSTDNAIARFDSTTGKVIQNSGITLSDANALQNVNEINFDITPASVVGGAGSLSWNSDDNTKTLQLIGNNDVPIKVGEENYYRIKASSAITKGQVLMFTGTLGSSGGLTAAPATGLTAATGNYILGVAKESGITNDWIYVQEFGEVKGINTSGSTASETWVNGDILYYNPAVTGGLTKNVPTAPNAKVQVAAVVHANASNGILFVRPTFEPRLNDLSNVFAISPSDGDVIVWDNGDSRWENRAQSSLTAGSATNLSGGATGSLPYQSSAGTTTFLPAGTDGQVLKLASGVPSWSSDTSGVTITDDTTTNATRYITFSNLTTGNETTLDVSSTKLQFNPSTGTLTATAFSGSGASLTSLNASNISSGTVAVGNGGTGQTSYTNGQLLIGNTTGNTLTKATLTAGTGISITNGAGSITITNTNVPYSADYVIVAGGGGGGANTGGGGGAGGYLSGTTQIVPGFTYSVTVGGGGAGGSSTAAGTNGSDSVALSLTALGGGGGGGSASPAGKSGGSGGASGDSTTVGSGTTGQGNNGGSGSGGYPSGRGGGGGASAVGADRSGAGGGGGFGEYRAGGTAGSGGAGGGGAGRAASGGTATAGTANTGGGGGGGGTYSGNGGAGGSGVVIISVPTAKYTGTTTGSPTVTTNGSNTVMQFNSSGSYTA